MECIKGAILIYSCHKHMNTRMKKYGLKEKEYAGWKVFYFIGNPNIESNFVIKDNIIMLKCEDSYIHVAKKVVMGIKYIYDNYIVEEGILRCGDDLFFIEENLLRFLNSPNKKDYIGFPLIHNVELSTKTDYFMPMYYLSNQQDLLNPLHNIPYTIDELMEFHTVPKIACAAGVVYYLSNKSCNILINHFEKIGWNVFLKDANYGYPYIIEDICVGFILYLNNIFVTHSVIYIDVSPGYSDVIKIGKSVIAFHTNEYK